MLSVRSQTAPMLASMKKETMVKTEVLRPGLVRLRGAEGRVLYVEARSAPSGVVWFVHVDGHGRWAARSYPCPTRELVAYRVASELSTTRCEAALNAASPPSSQIRQTQAASAAGA
jgi:hypothetical protein